MSSANGVRSGKGYILLQIRDETEQGLRDVQSRLNTYALSLAKIGAVTFGAGAGLGALFINPIRQAGDFAEIVSKFDTVFGSAADSVREWGQEYARQVGRSEKQITSFLADAKDTFTPLGFDPKEAADASKLVTKLAVDLASFNNISDEQAFGKLLSAVVGNTENLKTFGVVAQLAQIKAEALSQGFDANNLTAYQKAQAIIAITLRGTTAAMDDATRTSGSFVNQLKATQGTVENLQVAVGAALVPSLARVVRGFNRSLAAVVEFAQENNVAVAAIASLAGGLTGLGGGLIGVSVATFLAGKAFGGLATLVAPASAALELVLTLASGVANGLKILGVAALRSAIALNPLPLIFRTLVIVGKATAGALGTLTFTMVLLATGADAAFGSVRLLAVTMGVVSSQGFLVTTAMVVVSAALRDVFLAATQLARTALQFLLDRLSELSTTAGVAAKSLIAFGGAIVIASANILPLLSSLVTLGSVGLALAAAFQFVKFLGQSFLAIGSAVRDASVSLGALVRGLGADLSLTFSVLSESAREVFDIIAQDAARTFGEMARDGQAAFSIISEALDSGEFERAFTTAFQFLRAEALRISAVVSGIWDAVGPRIQGTFVAVFESIEVRFTNLIQRITNQIERLKIDLEEAKVNALNALTRGTSSLLPGQIAGEGKQSIERSFDGDVTIARPAIDAGVEPVPTAAETAARAAALTAQAQANQNTKFTEDLKKQADEAGQALRDLAAATKQQAEVSLTDITDPVVDFFKAFSPKDADGQTTRISAISVTSGLASADRAFLGSTSPQQKVADKVDESNSLLENIQGGVEAVTDAVGTVTDALKSIKGAVFR